MSYATGSNQPIQHGADREGERKVTTAVYTNENQNQSERVPVRCDTAHYSTTDISCAALLLERGCQVVSVTNTGNATRRRARWYFDNRDGQAAYWAQALYNRPDTVTINLAAYRTATKDLLRLADEYLA